MGLLIDPELSLDSRDLLKSVSRFLADVSRIDSVSEKISKLDDYVNRLQDEMKKIDAFKRELPFCMILLNDAIGMVRDELTRCRKSEPVLEQFIPMKNETEKDSVNRREKMNWMSSVQLWNNDNQNLLDMNKKISEEDNTHPVMDKGFVPFKGGVNFPVMAVGKGDADELPGGTGLSLSIPDVKNSREEIGFSSKSTSSRSASSCATNSHSNFKVEQQQSARKQRRCWSQELHRRFVSALDQLGGEQVATPKQIRELMKVEGLTNDEVKSHLQKFRIHRRRAPLKASGSNVEPCEPCTMLAYQPQSDDIKQCKSQFASPQGPLQLPVSSRVTSTTVGDSMEDEDDGKSESHSWKSHIQLSVK